MRFRDRLTCAATALLVALTPGAHAREADETMTSGPLVGSPSQCDPRDDSDAWSCSWWYDLVPAETNATEDYAAYWTVLALDPGRGWCAKEVHFSIDLPSSVRIASAVPDEGASFPRPVTQPTELVVDAEGAAPVPGRVWEDARIGRGRTQVTWGPRRFSYRWRGSSPRVYAVIGLQLALRQVPPEPASLWSETTGFGYGPCRQATVPMARLRP